MQRVLFIVRNHFTHDTRVLKEAKTLEKKGYNVTILCLWDVHLLKEEKNGTIIIRRLAYMSQKNSSIIHKIRALCIFSMACFLEARHAYTVIHCHDLDTLPIGAIITFFKRRTKLIYDAHEHETERAYVKGCTKKIYKILERLLVYRANSVITVSDSIADDYKRMYNIARPYLVLNCPPYQHIKPHNLFREIFHIEQDKIIYLYQGGLMSHRGIEMTLDAFKDINHAVVVFMGNGALQNQIKEAASRHNNIFHMDAVKPDILMNYTSSADVGLMLTENTSLNHYYCLPNKLFEYAMAQLPVVISNLLDARRIIDHYKNGIILEEYTSSALRELINELDIPRIRQMKLHAASFSKEYNWENQEKQLLAAYKDF